MRTAANNNMPIQLVENAYYSKRRNCDLSVTALVCIEAPILGINVLTDDPFLALQEDFPGHIPVSPAHGTSESPIMSPIQICPYAIFVRQWTELCLCWSLIVPHGDIVDYRQRTYNA